jgi:hypothetical protein
MQQSRGVRPTWNGRSFSGKPEPDGTYRWTLRGHSPTGTLRRANGSRKPISGTVRLDTVAPKVSIHAGRARTQHVLRQIPVRWACASGSCRYDISYQIRPHGSTRWTVLHRWLTRTSAHSARLGSKPSEVKVVASNSYRFVVRAFDVAGNESRAETTQPVRG